MRMKGVSRFRRSGGFSLIEVLIALVVLAFGLLGLALLQTVNLKYTQSANQRTQAVNLAGQLLDMMRSNRSELAAYNMDLADMSAITLPNGGCSTFSVLGAANNVARWKCEVKAKLGPDAHVKVGPKAGDPTTTEVVVGWQEVTSNPLAGEGMITLSTQL